jgi:hypothetical protein
MKKRITFKERMTHTEHARRTLKAPPGWKWTSHGLCRVGFCSLDKK